MACVVMRNVDKGFGGQVVLRKVSLAIGNRERVGLTGRNGEGKTTLLRLIAGGEAPDEGAIERIGGLSIGLLDQTKPLDHSGTLEEAMREYLERKYFLEGTYLFGDRISGATRNAITHALGERTAESGERIVPDDSILAVAEGTIEVHCGDRHIYTARPSEVIGGVQLLGDDLPEITYVAHTACRCYFIPCAVVEEIPIVRWKLLEQINRTMRSCISAFQG